MKMYILKAIWSLNLLWYRKKTHTFDSIFLWTFSFKVFNLKGRATEGNGDKKS